MGLHFIPNDTKIDFIGFRKIAYAISLVLLLAGMVALVAKGGPRYGIDFAGGTVVQIEFKAPISDEEVKKAMEQSNLPGLVVQEFGEGGRGYLLRISSQEDQNASQMRAVITDAIDKNLPSHEYEVQRLEMVGPKVGADLRAGALEALFYATLLISVYVSGRFEQHWTIAILMAVILGGGIYALGHAFALNKGILVLAAAIITVLVCWRLKLAFAIGAIVSIVHDLMITVGIFVIMDKEFDLTIIAALLTIVGYSLNDTIIVFDRIRENLRNNKKREKLGTIINKSVNQTLSRTVLTSGTTLLVVFSLLLLGGDIIHDFALVLFIGIFIGTFSSIFVAAPILLFFEDSIFTQVTKERETKEKDEVQKRNKGLPQV